MLDIFAEKLVRISDIPGVEKGRTVTEIGRTYIIKTIFLKQR